MLVPEIKIIDGREFYIKDTRCRKAWDLDGHTERNSAWVANEFIYATFAKVAGLRMPESLILDYQGDKVFGSEALPNRCPLPKDANMKQLCELESNRTHLVRALLLDLALLNSDRTLPNILLDEKQLLWFYDHEKALLGDGKPPQGGQGDLGRLDPNTLPEKLHAFIGDYLVSVQCNSVVFAEENSEVVLDEFKALPLDLRYLDDAIAKMPDDWLTKEQQEAMRRFLPKWWQALKGLFAQQDSRRRISEILLNRRSF